MSDVNDIQKVGPDGYIPRKKGKKRGASFKDEKSGVNLNSMMDMMTIILTFLMKSIGAEPIQTNQSADLRLPMSDSEVNPEDMLVLYISKKWVMVGDKGITPVSEGKIDPSLLQSAESGIIPELQQAIEDSMKNQEQWARVTGREQKKIVTIVSDSDTPYRILTQVMMTAGVAGIQNFKFAIIQAERKAGN
jgi:biopolymer transport protein ExbD